MTPFNGALPDYHSRSDFHRIEITTTKEIGPRRNFVCSAKLALPTCFAYRGTSLSNSSSAYGLPNHLVKNCW